MDNTNSIIDNLLKPFEPLLGHDFVKYKNHVSRVYANCLLLDNVKENEAKYAVAAVFHDIGIWTDHTIDYLDPSIVQARKYLVEQGKQGWTDEISRMIYWHHKKSTYKGDYQKTTETFRRADWIDVSLGLMTFGADRQSIRKIKTSLPNCGFHWLLVKKILRNFFSHPLNPLPMFKK